MYSIEKMLHRMHVHPDGFTALTYNYFLSQFAMGMVGLFGVVYLFEMFDEWYWGLVLVAVFYSVQRIVVILLMPVIADLLGRVGYRRVMALSLMAVVVRLLLFMGTTQERIWLLVPAVVIGGFYLAGYYLAFNCLFLDDNDNEQIGTQIGFLSLVKRLALVVSPFVAGVVVQQFGFEVLFGLGIIVLFGSLVPLFAMPHHKHSMKGFSMKKVMEQYEEHPHFTRAVYFWNISDIVLITFWPLYLLLLLQSYAVLGVVSSAVMLASGLSVYAAGKVYDQRSLRRVFPIAVILVSLTWGLRFLAESMVVVVSADVLGRLIDPLWWMKIRRFELRFGERINTMVFGVAHMLLESAGAITGLFVGVVLVLYSGGNWAWLLVPGVGGVLLSAWAAKDK